MPKHSYAPFLLNFFIHATVLFTFLTLFFFSNQAVHKTEQIDAQIGALVEHVARHTDPQNVQLFHTYIQEVEIPRDTTHTQNSCLFRWAIGICVLMAAVTVGFALWKRSSIDFREIWQENVVVLTCIFLFEFLFFHVFVKRYEAVASHEVLDHLQSVHLPG